MRVTRLFSVLIFLALFSSCTDDLETVVFYNKDVVNSSLFVSYNGNISKQQAASSSTLNLSASTIFNENLSKLREVTVTKLSYAVKQVNASAMCLSKMQVYLDDVAITDFLDLKDFKSKNVGVSFEITDANLLATLSSKLLANNKVVFMCKEKNPDSEPLYLEINFSLAVSGTFVD